MISIRLLFIEENIYFSWSFERYDCPFALHKTLLIHKVQYALFHFDKTTRMYSIVTQ